MAKDSAIVLAPGVSFADWESDLQAALVKKGRLGHVFHNIKEIIPIIEPIEPTRTEGQSDSDFSSLHKDYEMKAAMWREGEIEAKNILMRRLSEGVRPQNFRRMTAKQVFDNISSSREEGAAMPHETAVRNFHELKFTTIEDYCDNFMQCYLSINSAAESMVPHISSNDSGAEMFSMPAGLAAQFFVLGTEGINWLDTWRQTKIFDSSNHYVSLEVMMSTLRQAGTSKQRSSGQAMVAAGPGDNENSRSKVERGGGPNDQCRQCRHRHKNKECFKQHPELARKSKRRGKGKKIAASVAVNDEDSDESDDSDGLYVSKVTKVATASLQNNPLLYDTGALHHFIRSKKDFIFLQNLSKPFKFEQAVGKSVLTQKGNCRISIGQSTLELSDALFSPDSSCNILSAVKLKKEHGIVAANENELLVRKSDNTPVARLKIL